MCCVHKIRRGENGEVEYCMYDSTHRCTRYTVATRTTARGNRSLNVSQSPTADLHVATGSKTGRIVVTLALRIIRKPGRKHYEGKSENREPAQL